MHRLQLQELKPALGWILKSPSGSLHIIVGDEEGYPNYKTVRIDPKANIREGEVLRTQSITPERGIVVYSTDPSRRNELLRALNDSTALKMLSRLLKNIEILVPASSTLGRERNYKAFLSNVPQPESLCVHQERVLGHGPLIEVDTIYGGRTDATINFVFATDDHLSQVPAYIRQIKADPEIRSVLDYEKLVGSVVEAACLFNMVVPVLDAGRPQNGG